MMIATFAQRQHLSMSSIFDDDDDDPQPQNIPDTTEAMSDVQAGTDIKMSDTSGSNHHIPAPRPIQSVLIKRPEQHPSTYSQPVQPKKTITPSDRFSIAYCAGEFVIGTPICRLPPLSDKDMSSLPQPDESAKWIMDTTCFTHEQYVRQPIGTIGHISSKSVVSTLTVDALLSHDAKSGPAQEVFWVVSIYPM